MRFVLGYIDSKKTYSFENQLKSQKVSIYLLTRNICLAIFQTTDFEKYKILIQGKVVDNLVEKLNRKLIKFPIGYWRSNEISCFTINIHVLPSEYFFLIFFLILYNQFYNGKQRWQYQSYILKGRLSGKTIFLNNNLLKKRIANTLVLFYIGYLQYILSLTHFYEYTFIFTFMHTLVHSFIHSYIHLLLESSKIMVVDTTCKLLVHANQPHFLIILKTEHDEPHQLLGSY